MGQLASSSLVRLLVLDLDLFLFFVSLDRDLFDSDRLLLSLLLLLFISLLLLLLLSLLLLRWLLLLLLPALLFLSRLPLLDLEDNLLCLLGECLEEDAVDVAVEGAGETGTVLVIC